MCILMYILYVFELKIRFKDRFVVKLDIVYPIFGSSWFCLIFQMLSTHQRRPLGVDASFL